MRCLPHARSVSSSSVMAEPALVRWLLVLGSNADDAGGRLDAAIAAIGRLGTIEQASRRVDGDDVGGRGPRYLNQLLRMSTVLDEQTLRAALKQIEAGQGRSEARLAQGICDLDVDLLAWIGSDDRPEFVADKPLAIPAVRLLLREAGY